jgi:membrane protein
MILFRRLWHKTLGPLFSNLGKIMDGVFVFEPDMFKNPSNWKRVTKLYTIYVNWILRFIERFDNHHVFLFSGALSFSLFMCIIPMTLIMFFILGNFLSSVEFVGRINTFIDAIIPYESYAEFAKTMISGRIEELVEYRNVAGIVGSGALMFAASGFFSSIRTVLHRVFDVPEQQNIIISKLFDFLLILIMIVVFFAVFLLIPALMVVQRIAMELPFLGLLDSVFLKDTFTMGVSFLLIFVLFYFFYRVVPSKKIRKVSLFVGALVASGLWVLAKFAFGYYIDNVASFGQIYGTYSLLIVIAFWIYYSNIVFIVGAELARLYDENVRVKEKIAGTRRLDRFRNWLDDQTDEK